MEGGHISLRNSTCELFKIVIVSWPVVVVVQTDPDLDCVMIWSDVSG